MEKFSALTLNNGTISYNGKSLTYGGIVANVEDWGDIPDPPVLKDRSEFKYIGKPISRVDLKDKVLAVPYLEWMQAIRICYMAP